MCGPVPVARAHAGLGGPARARCDLAPQRPSVRIPNGLLYRLGYSLTLRAQVSFHSCFGICLAGSHAAMHRLIGVSPATALLPTCGEC